jgi:hypothetical protein
MAIKPLICSCGGISWAELKQWQLQTLATAKWVAVWSAHRGLTDCIYLAQVHERTSNSEDITTPRTTSGDSGLTQFTQFPQAASISSSLLFNFRNSSNMRRSLRFASGG